MSKLLITRKQNAILTFLLDENGRALEITAKNVDETSLLGNIYVGYVKNIVKNIAAAFIELADPNIGYCSLKEKCSYLFGAHSSSKNLSEGDRVLVQVTKENIKTKQPTVTGKLQLTGKYLVLLHGDGGLHFSNKLKDKNEIASLKEALEPFVTEDTGFIVRTNAAGVPTETVSNEAVRLLAKMEEIKHGTSLQKGTLLYREIPQYLELLRDYNSSLLTEVITDDPDIFRDMKDYAEEYQPEDLEKLRFYEDSSLSLWALYSLSSKLSEATNDKVLLNSGASLIIEPTETMTVIDVNTGKAISKKNASDDVFFKINTEAAKECMRQLRLRNLSGMILIDFINMEKEDCNVELLNYLRKLAKEDRIPVEVVDMTGLKLVELTRKKTKKPLHEMLRNIIFE